MGTWNEFLQSEGVPPAWPYPIKFGEEKEIEADVVVLGGGIAGCWAAISAAREDRPRPWGALPDGAPAREDRAAITGATSRPTRTAASIRTSGRSRR